MLVLNKSKKFIFFFISIVASHALFGQKAERKQFAAMFNGTPGMIEVDLSLKKVGPINSQPYIISTALKIFDCDKNGLPSKEEVKIINQLSHAVQLLLKKTLKYSNAGTFVHNCVCLDYYFVSDTSGIREKLSTLYKNEFANRTLGLNIKEDKKWDTYFDFLYPNDNYRKLKDPIIIQPE